MEDMFCYARGLADVPELATSTRATAAKLVAGASGFLDKNLPTPASASLSQLARPPPLLFTASCCQLEPHPR